MLFHVYVHVRGNTDPYGYVNHPIIIRSRSFRVSNVHNGPTPLSVTQVGPAIAAAYVQLGASQIERIVVKEAPPEDDPNIAESPEAKRHAFQCLVA